MLAIFPCLCNMSSQVTINVVVRMHVHEAKKVQECKLKLCCLNSSTTLTLCILTVLEHFSSWGETEHWVIKEWGSVAERKSTQGPVRQGLQGGGITHLSVCVCLCMCQYVTGGRNTLSATNIWSPPKPCLQSCIIPVTQPKIALLWQFIYYSRASCFCLRVSVTHTCRGRCFPPL